MANVTVTSAAAFIPEIWANAALKALRNRLVLARLVTRDTDVSPFNQGDILHIPVPGTFSVNDKAANTPVTLQVPTDATVDVTLNKHKEVSFLIEDPVRAQQNQDVMGRYIRNAIIPIAEQVEKDLFALYAGLSQTVGTTATAVTPAVYLSAITKLWTANADSAPIYGILSVKDTAALLSDATLAAYFANSNVAAIQQAEIGPLYGSTLYRSNLTPITTVTSTHNLVITPEFAILAVRGMPTDAGGTSGVEQFNYVDPESGIGFRMTTSYNASNLGVQVTFDILYGVAELRDVSGIHLLS